MIRLVARVHFLRFFHLPLLFALPLYYVSQASDVIWQANNSRSEYRQCVRGLELAELRIPPTPAPAADPTIITPQSTAPAPAYSLPESLLKLEAAWNAFVDDRVAEWRIAVTIACVFVACVHSNTYNLVSGPNYIQFEAQLSQSFRFQTRLMTYLHVLSLLSPFATVFSALSMDRSFHFISEVR